jgi:L-asparaginase II
MEDPVLVEVTRGGRVESAHRGALAVVDADGAVLLALGDVERPVFARSAVKAIQALPLVESGAADAFGFGAAELALACASHQGEPAHAGLADAMLARAGCDVACLECGSHWPSLQEATIALARSGGSPTPLHNNCSGKHAGFVCTAVHAGWPVMGYIGASHPVQEGVRAALADVTGTALGPADRGIDGCSIPAYAIPLRNLAHGFARLASGTGLAPERARAARRLIEACFAEPFFVGGTGRFDTEIMTALPGRAFSKVGAEGVHCAALPELGLGLAIKCDDGAGRASETVAANLVAGLLRLSEGERQPLAARLEPPLHSRRGVRVGEVRAAAALVQAAGF